MTQKQVKIIRSVGTASGVFNQGAEPFVDEALAESWVNAGFAEYIEEKKPSDPEEVPPIEVAVDKPTETKPAKKPRAPKADK